MRREINKDLGFAESETVLGGPAVVGDTLYWGSGYFNLKRGIPNNKLYAFFVPGP